MIYDAIIVGGGVAGLTAASYLSKAGYSVLLCEKQEKCGGLVNTFQRNGFTYDGGIRAMENAGALFPMLKHLGLDIDFINNKVSIGIKGKVIHIESKESLDAYGDLLTYFFPDSNEEITAIINEIRKIMTYMDIQYGIDNPLFLDFKENRDYFIHEVLPWMFKYAITISKINSLDEPVEQYLKNFTQNQPLLDIISQHFFTATPAFFALSYISLYLDYIYPKGGTGSLIIKLVNYIESHGGQINTNTEILSIDPQKKILIDQSGRELKYRQLLWAADLKSLYQRIQTDDLTDQKFSDLVKKNREDLSNLTGNNSIFTIFAASDLAPGFFGKIASAHFFYTPSAQGQSKAGDPPFHGTWEEIRSWLNDFFELTTYEISIPVLRDSNLAPEGKTGLMISLLFDYGLAQRIKELGHYEDFKQLSEEKIIGILDRSIYPGFKSSLIESFSSTPLTMKEITNNTDGAITGWAFTNEFIPAENRLSRIAKSVDTPLPNIYQAGQWTFSPSGFPISLITGKLAADKIIKNLKKLA